eukprot:757583-Hanusia_phi.AAC.2
MSSNAVTDVGAMAFAQSMLRNRWGRGQGRGGGQAPLLRRWRLEGRRERRGEERRGEERRGAEGEEGGRRIKVEDWVKRNFDTFSSPEEQFAVGAQLAPELHLGHG